MKGKIFKWSGHYSNGYVLDENGKQHFVHESEMISNGNLRNGVIIEFDSIEQPECKHPRAVNIKKIGHGNRHPFIKDLERLKDCILGNVSDTDDEKVWRLRDVEMLINYFSEVEDIEWCDDVRARFRPKRETDKEG